MRAKKLIFFTKTTKSRLLFKLLLYSLSVYLCFLSPLGYIFLFLTFVYFYFSAIERVYFKSGFIFLFFLNVFLMPFKNLWPFSFFISLFLFFLLLSVVDFIFFNRKTIYGFFNLFLFLSILFLILKSAAPFLWQLFFIFILSFALARENLVFYFNSFYRRFNLLSFVLSFILVQFFCLFNFFAISSFSSIFLLSFIYVCLKDFSIFYVEGKLNKSRIIFYLTAGVIMFALNYVFTLI